MHSYFWLISILFLIGFKGFSQDEQQIRQVFTAYKEAVTNKDGITAYSLINQKTTSFYQRVWDDCKKADSITVSKYPFEEKLWVLTSRHLIPEDLANQLTVKEVFCFLLRKNWIHKEDLSMLEIGEMEIDGAFAIAQMQYNGADIPYFFQFEKEGNGHWKVNLIEMLEAAGRNVEAIIAAGNLSENKFIIESIEKISGKKTNKKIWLPYKS
ncbi:hypothetical protein NBRC110019_29600 [Neptunitalea chrysea]|uniref:Uncharacterized protein n=1 Tax=Neptunitalea chrysea TaxID=1647581 RepID=A0A9W6B710_9FLAO|nr:hypothetical protein [Neptunitalea chrysea]GLB53919.1 hypothetical protein NBRC110019_29600 [Neptunitalea chrysea]